MKTTYYTGKLGGRTTVLNPAEIDTGSSAVQKYEFEHREISGEDEIEAGRRATEAGLFAANGTADENAVLTHKGYTLVERMVTGWNQKNGDAALPIMAATVRTLPGVVARRFAADQLFGAVPTQAEIDLISKKPEPHTGDTQAMEQSA